MSNSRKNLESTEQGFSIVEVIVAIIVISILVVIASSVSTSGLSINGRTTLYTDASSLAFKKVQDYANMSFDDIPIGDNVDGYEVEDFSTEAEGIQLRNADAKVLVTPQSVVSTTTTTTETAYSQQIAADTAYVAGSEIENDDEDDATGDYYRPSRIGDDNYSNYTYSAYASDPDNMASPSIDLGSAEDVDIIRIDWYTCGYGSDNFRVEAKNSSPNSNSGWTTIVSGLSDNGIPCSIGSHPQDIDVSANSTAYRYWRLFIVDAEDDDYNAFSELEAFSSTVPGDTVEQHGSDASSSPGALYFSSTDLEMSLDGSRGHQSIGMLFDNVTPDHGAQIDNAYLEFTADQANSGSVTLKVSAADVDNASPWTTTYAVDHAVDSDASDGSTGTTATVTWTPAAWSSNEVGADTRVNVTAIVQEIVDRANWDTGNDMAFAVQYVSGADKRTAKRSPAPKLHIEWSEETISTNGNGYVDADSDGDADNPTLLKIDVILEYDSFGNRQKINYSSLVRRNGLGT